MKEVLRVTEASKGTLLWFPVVVLAELATFARRVYGNALLFGGAPA